jgi:hypothetical protein
MYEGSSFGFANISAEFLSLPHSTENVTRWQRQRFRDWLFLVLRFVSPNTAHGLLHIAPGPEIVGA